MSTTLLQWHRGVDWKHPKVRSLARYGARLRKPGTCTLLDITRFDMTNLRSRPLQMIGTEKLINFVR